ncbi:hypothetical protein B0H13DRAFT_2305730 [Mycena leptocephala]|nr:hypothetical protein B0H13DRAFT_2305730 [Mycena leptocephala]
MRRRVVWASTRSHYSQYALLPRHPLLPSKLLRSLSRRCHARPSPALRLDADAEALAPASHSSTTDQPDAEGRTAASAPYFLHLRFVLCAESRRAGSISAGYLQHHGLPAAE